MKIALLQTDIVWENKSANLQRCSEMIAALPNDVHLIVLPEMFTTGFSMKPDELAEREDGQTLQWLRDKATKSEKAIIGSVIIEENKKYFNRLYFVFPDGSYQTYDKRHLFSMGGENLCFTSGNQRLIVEYEGWRICPLICYDLRFPIWSRNLNNVYDLLIYVANWPSARISVWNTLLAARAIENQSYVLGANRCGVDGLGVSHNGQSQAINFKGEQIICSENDKEDTIITELSLNELHTFREKFPAWKDADMQ